MIYSDHNKNGKNIIVFIMSSFIDGLTKNKPKNPLIYHYHNSDIISIKLSAKTFRPFDI